MTFTQPLRSPRKIWPNKESLPTMYDLPSEDPEEPGLPDEFHDYQPALLSETFKLSNYTSEDIFSAADLNLYYDSDHNWYKRPDWFGVIGQPEGCDSDVLRLSYVVWQEALIPFVVVELISPGTENEDFGRTEDKQGRPPTKWTVYERILQIPYYVIYNRYDNSLKAFRLERGRYQPITIGADRTIWFPEISAGIGTWQGKYKRFTREWLRWYDEGGWIPTEKEASNRQILQERLAKQRAEGEANRAKQAAEEASQEADELRDRNERLQAKLKELGIDIDEL
ncbi:MAG: Uma2 family endonuclease [Cyanobacteria bacterium P01_D01_bin.1]